jgi:cobalt-zinc-cadmium efflux system outer membrane protein
MTLHPITSVFMLVTLAGCASLDPAADIAQTATTVAARTGVPVPWQAGADARRTRTGQLLVPPLTAPHAVEIALINSPRVAMLQSEIGIARADRVQAGLVKNPLLDAARLAPHNGSAQLDLGLGFDLLGLLSLPARMRLAEQSYDAARLRITDDLLAFAGEVQTRYIDAVAAKQLAATLAEIVAAYDASAELAYRLNRAGNLDAARRDRELLAWQTSRQLQAAAALRADALRAGLQLQLGIDDALDAKTLPDALPPLPSDEIALADLQARANAASLDVQRSVAEIDAKAKRMGYDQATALLPELRAGYGWEREAVSGAWWNGPSLSLSLPLFDLGSARQARNVARLNQLRQALRQQQAILAAALRIASERLSATRAAVEQDESILLPLAKRVVEASQLQYNAGQTSTFELLADRRRQMETERAHIEALRDYWQARAVIDGLLAGASPPSLDALAGTLATTATTDTGGN